MPAKVMPVSMSLRSIPDFRRLLWVGFVASTVRWLEMLAMALFAYKATDSALAVVMLSMLRVLPMGLFGAFLGAAADRFELRNALIVMVTVSTACTLTLALLASLGALAVWHLMVASFVSGVCWAADNPVRRMMIGEAVGIDRMGSAISVDIGINNASRVLGPMLAGLLFAQHGMSSVLWLGVALYATSLAAALRMGRRGISTVAHQASFITRLREGLAWLRGDRRLIGVFLVTVIFNLFGWPCNSMIPIIATGTLHLGPQDVGLLASCEGVGGLIGALLFARFARPNWYGRIYLGTVVIYLATMIAFATVGFAPAAAVILLFNGAAVVGFAVMQATLVYRGAPVEMRARLLGVLSACIGTGPIGFLYLGFLADALTPPIATVAIAVQGLLAMLLTRRYWAKVLQP
jgi:MFS family permease